MKKIIAALAFVLSFSFNSAFAQTAEVSSDLNIPPKAVIKAKDFVEVEKSIIFDASQSFSPVTAGESVTYNWDFGDGNKDIGSEVVHTYSKSGPYEVTLTVKTKNGEDSEKISIFVYNRLILLITDNDGEKDFIEGLNEHARREGVYLKIVQSFNIGTEFLAEDALIQKLGQAKEEIKLASQIVIWTKSGSGLKLISRLPVELEDASIDYAGKDIFFITDEAISTIARIARGSYKLFRPKQIIITREESLYPLVEQENTELFLAKVEQRSIPFTSVNSENSPLGGFSFLTSTINFLIEKNVPINSIILILMLPVIVTVIAFLKQIIGLSTLGVYTPAIITLSFLALDLRLGLIFLLATMIVGSITHSFFRRYRLLYIPRMAVLLSIVSLTIIGILTVGSFFNISRIASVSIFPMLVMSTLAEKFVSIQGDKGFKSAFYTMLETIFVAIVAYVIVGGEVDLIFTNIKIEFVRTLIFSYPELIFLFILINIALGRWTGLRLSEYIRFREILRRAEE